MGSSVYSTPVPANGAMYITNRNQLFALAETPAASPAAKPATPVASPASQAAANARAARPACACQVNACSAGRRESAIRYMNSFDFQLQTRVLLAPARLNGSVNSRASSDFAEPCWLPIEVSLPRATLTKLSSRCVPRQLMWLPFTTSTLILIAPWRPAGCRVAADEKVDSIIGLGGGSSSTARKPSTFC